MAVKTSYQYLRENAVQVNVSKPYGQTNRSSTSKLTRSRTSANNPKWKQIIADGGNATTALTAYEQYATIKSGYVSFSPMDDTKRQLTNSYLGLQGPYVLDPSTLTSASFNALAQRAVAKATSKIYERVTELQAPFQGQIFAGELREVLNMIKNPFAATAGLLERFIKVATRHKEFRSAIYMTRKERKLKLLKKQLTALPYDMASAWLEFSFAIKPLLDDIVSLIELAETVSERREHEIIRGYGDAISATDLVTPSSPSGTTGLNLRREEIILDKAQCIIRCGLSKEFLEKVRGDTNNLRNSIDDLFTLPSMFWELLPWSFFIDYFVNIGDIIGAAAVSESGIAWTSNTVIRTKEVKYVIGSPHITRTDLVASIGSNQPKMIVYGVRSVTRTSTLAGIPPVVFSLPGKKVQYANILALLVNLTK